MFKNCLVKRKDDKNFTDPLDLLIFTVASACRAHVFKACEDGAEMPRSSYEINSCLNFKSVLCSFLIMSKTTHFLRPIDRSVLNNGLLDGNDELRHHGQDLWATLAQTSLRNCSSWKTLKTSTIEGSFPESLSQEKTIPSNPNIPNIKYPKFCPEPNLQSKPFPNQGLL